ncbi:MAG: amidohydrolase, partial [Deltaproteobacteria bacterium]|nr:amidohydrolase [Deltaproteobacteria bacterium]MBW1979016.1 amidohydrolase [Deltaproteobacteria bacterium]MBW2045146.1 amidohydrolase [Deltaproteobacteria bacterium]
LTMDNEQSVIKSGFVGIKEDRICLIGKDPLEKPRAKKVIDAEEGLILPGLINSHTHAAMTLFRGLADDLPLMEWLNKYIFPVEKKMDEDFVYLGTSLACAEMIMSGTTTFCDMYLFEHAVARAAREAGMRCLVGEVLYDFPSPNYGEIKNGFRYTESLIRKWEEDPLVSVAVEPHSLYTCSPELLVAANHLAAEFKVPLIVHVAETATEIEQVRDKYRKRPFEHLESLGILGPHLVAVHCVHLNEQEIQRMVAHDVKVVHNPESNMKLASGISPVSDMLARGLTVGLGTDGCASNNNLDLFGEMDTAAKLQKVSKMDPTVLKAHTVLNMATRGGAKALGMESMIGSLEVGKQADVIVVDTNRPHLTPMYDPYSHLVYAAKASDVTHSIINGRLVMERRELLSIDFDEIAAGVKKKAKEILRWVSG